jgi:hypothetical protein
MSNTPIGCTNVNFIELIKSKGNSASLENQVPLGGYHGGHPPKKMAPFFRKNSSQMR